MIPQGSTKVSHLEGIAEDLALALQVESVLVRSLPSEGCVGIFIPRPPDEIEMVMWRDLLGITPASSKMTLPICLGVDWLGTPVYDDLAMLPHLLVAGTTGGGKSVFMRSIIASIVYNGNNKIVLSDTKGVEFTEFIGNSSLWSGTNGEIATSPMRTIEQMDLLCKETDDRLDLFGKFNYRNIAEYNQGISDKDRIPYIILVIDELADIVFLPGEKGRASKIGADKLDYLTRKARAAGIHVIAGTQRPSVDTVKGVIKANFSARIAFKTASSIDSKVILDEVGAENLLKRGDMLYKSPNHPGLQRLHSGYASSADIKGALDFARFSNTINLLDEGDKNGIRN
jgi:S-DNA-T family DNA segregation ATPase FtsK/SpoIIIE